MKKFLSIMAGVGGTIVTADFLYGCYCKVRSRLRRNRGGQGKVVPLSGQTIGFKTKAELEAMANRN